MNRRRLLGFLCASALIPCAAPQPSRMRRIGVVFYRAPQASLGATPSFFLAVTLRNELQGLGWAEGTNIRFEWRSAEGRDERLPLIMNELLSVGVDLLAVSGNNITEAAMRASSTIPIVMLASTSPVEQGLVTSLSNPGGNVTGVTLNSQPELVGKRLELLKEAAPGARRVAMLHDGITREVAEAQAQGARIGLDILPYAVDSGRDLQHAMDSATRKGAQAVSVETSYGSAPATHAEIRAVVEKYRRPMIHRFREAVASGHALMSYAADPLDDYRRAAVIIDRILRRARPGDIPIESMNRFYLDVNLRLAESIGWRIPGSIVARADNVIR